jgi:hypothetical protein
VGRKRKRTSEEDEMRRRFRELLLRQPEDAGLVLRRWQALSRAKVSRAEEERRRIEEVLEGLGEQLL